jgi:predicted metal-binding membrane protein
MASQQVAARGGTLVERVIRHERRVLVATLAAAVAACWAWIVPMARDMYGAMAGPAAWMMTGTWDVPHVLLLGAMWVVMMAGMMLPSAAPALLLYAGAARRRSGARRAAWHVYAMAGGYLLVWAAFSIGATALQRMLSALLLLSPMMELTSPLLSGALLVVAGVYQLTPLKSACLTSCSAPLVFLTRRWRDGVAGAFRLGLEHGLSCVGCCWALMLLLFAGGVMNLAVIGALTALVLAEKLAPWGARSVRPTGILLIAVGLWVAADAHWLV